MKEISVDCASIGDARQFHDILARALEFPQWYGRNLDALHDQLTAITADTRLILRDFDRLGPFRQGFRTVLNDAEDRNPHFYADIL